MKEIRQLSNEVLLQQTKLMVNDERKITLLVLHHLQEVYRRRLYAAKGFQSLFDFATKGLGYSDAAAARRIAAMKLLKDLPEVEEKIKKGDLSLSNVAQAQRFFQSEAKLNHPFNIEKKKEILETLTQRSTREVEKTLLQHSSQPIELQKPDQVKPITPTHSEIRFIADQTLLDQLEAVRDLLANKNPNLNMAQLITEMAKLSLEKLKPRAPQEPSSKKLRTQESKHEKPKPKDVRKDPILNLKPEHGGVGAQTKDTGSKQTAIKDEESQAVTSRVAGSQKRSRYISVKVKRVVYHRDKGQCQYTDPVTGKKCLSSRAPQYEHVVPFAVGGETSVSNLKVCCSLHNKLLAIEYYGANKMGAYLGLNE
jgi:5-methylcytosine-specific restriction endonuclease McrA